MISAAKFLLAPPMSTAEIAILTSRGSFRSLKVKTPLMLLPEAVNSPLLIWSSMAMPTESNGLENWAVKYMN